MYPKSWSVLQTMCQLFEGVLWLLIYCFKNWARNDFNFSLASKKERKRSPLALESLITIASFCGSRLALHLAISVCLMLLSTLSICTYRRLGGRNRVDSIATSYVDRIPAGAMFSAPVQTSTGAQRASCKMGTASFSWG